MANTVNVTTANTFDQWRVKTNEIGTGVGDLDNLTVANTGGIDVVVSLASLKDDIETNATNITTNTNNITTNTNNISGVTSGIDDVILDGTSSTGQTIYIDTDVPLSSEGANGDVWFEY